MISFQDTKTADLLKECKQALLNRDAVRCYESGHNPCQCTLCKIDRYLEELCKPIMDGPLPTDEEIGAAVDQLSKESCAPDRETPDWMKADIRRGMIWMKERLTSFKTNQS